MPALKAIIAATALLIASQAAHAEESPLMRDKLVIENHRAIQAEHSGEATASTVKQTAEQKKAS